MSDNNNSSSISTGVAGLLGVAFVVLKLTGHINWSWWWVTLPFWIAIPIVVIFFIVIILASILTRGGR